MYAVFCALVALRKESVDRNNTTRVGVSGTLNVALRKESVDRNAELIRPSAACSVALRKESVDRNMKRPGVNYFKMEVALRKESVDRNAQNMMRTKDACGRSPQGERG